MLLIIQWYLAICIVYASAAAWYIAVPVHKGLHQLGLMTKPPAPTWFVFLASWAVLAVVSHILAPLHLLYWASFQSVREEVLFESAALRDKMKK